MEEEEYFGDLGEPEVEEEDGDVYDDDEEEEWEEDEEDEERKKLPTVFGEPINQYEQIENNMAAATSTERLLAVATLFTYGVPASKDVMIRFIVGSFELNKNPGQGSKEIMKVSRQWYELKNFAKFHPWRKILANSFTGISGNRVLKNTQLGRQKKAVKMEPPAPFTIDGITWNSVSHYLYGMAYATTPEYAILYSLNSKENKAGFWGTVPGAEMQHRMNVESGRYPIDPSFRKNLRNHLYNAMLAKFTQNPIAKQALLLTEDAYIATREKGSDLLDVDLYTEIRSLIRKNPTIVFNGPNSATTTIEAEREAVLSTEELNIGFIDVTLPQPDVDIKTLVLGNIEEKSKYSRGDIKALMSHLNPNAYIEMEPIATSSCYVYAMTGAYSVDFTSKQFMKFGAPKFVARHVYGIERFGDNEAISFFIGFQTTPTSFIRNYIAYRVLFNEVKVALTMYFEPIQDGYSVMMVSSDKHSAIMDFVESIRSEIQFIEPNGGK